MDKTSTAKRKPRSKEDVTSLGFRKMLATRSNRDFFEDNPNAIGLLRRIADFGKSTSLIVRKLDKYRSVAETKMQLPGVTVIGAKLVESAISSGNIKGPSRAFLDDYADRNLRTTVEARLGGISVYDTRGVFFVAYTFDEQTSDVLTAQHSRLANDVLDLADYDYEPHITVAKAKDEATATVLAMQLSRLSLPTTTVTLHSAQTFPNMRW